MNKRLRILSVLLFFFSSLVVAQNLTKEEWEDALGEARAEQSVLNFQYAQTAFLDVPETLEEFIELETRLNTVEGLDAFASTCTIGEVLIHFYFSNNAVNGLLFYDNQLTAFDADFINESFLFKVGEDEVELWFPTPELCKGIRINDDFSLATPAYGRATAYFDHGYCQAILGRQPAENLKLVYEGRSRDDHTLIQKFVSINVQGTYPQYTISKYFGEDSGQNAERSQPADEVSSDPFRASYYWLYESSSCGMPGWQAYTIDHYFSVDSLESVTGNQASDSVAYGQSVHTTLYNEDYLLQASFGCDESGCGYLNLESVTVND